MDEVELVVSPVELGEHLEVQVWREVDQLLPAETFTQRQAYASSFADVSEVSGANRVTSCPRATNPSHSVAITRSVPPYAPGGTAS